MKLTSYLAFTCLAFSVACVANAQTLPSTKPTTQSAEKMWQTPLPEIKLDHVSLDEVVAFLHDLNPGFNATVMRDPGVPQGYPAITFRGRNFNIDQLLAFLRIAYGLEDSSFEGTDGSSFYVLKVRFDDKVQSYLDANPLARPSQVKVYSLRELVSEMTVTGTTITSTPSKQAMNDILSLLQATLTEAGMGKTVSIKAHEATHSLIINATPVQHDLIENTLGTLRRSSNELGQINVALQQQIEELRTAQRSTVKPGDAQSSTTRPKE